MAYRRRQQVLSSSSSSTSSTSFRFEEEEEDKTRHPLPPPQSDDSLAAKAIRASSAHRDSSLSSVYFARGAQPAVNSSSPTSSLPSRYSNPATMLQSFILPSSCSPATLPEACRIMKFVAAALILMMVSSSFAAVKTSDEHDEYRRD